MQTKTKNNNKYSVTGNFAGNIFGELWLGTSSFFLDKDVSCLSVRLRHYNTADPGEL